MTETLVTLALFSVQSYKRCQGHSETGAEREDD